MRTRLICAAVCLLASVSPASAWIEAPMSFGEVIRQSQTICLMTVTKVDKQNNLIIYQKTADLKGKHPQDTIKHNIGRGGLRPGEWQEIMNWAEVGKTAVFFHNGSASETFFGASWYQAYPNGEWWGMSHGEPFLLRSFAGKVDKCAQAVRDIEAGKEIVVSCMVDGDKEALHKKTAKVQRVKASNKLLEYNPKRDFVGWGGEDIRRVAGMPGFDKLAALGKTDADAQAISVVDFDGDGKPDVCLAGANKVALLQNNGDGFGEVSLPGLVGGSRAAVWADYNADGKPDLLLATATGPKLYTNLGKGLFRDDTKVMPALETPVSAAAWGDFDGDGMPDVLLATAFDGLKLFRNIRTVPKTAPPPPPTFGPWHAVGPFRKMPDGKENFETAFSPEDEKTLPDFAKVHKGKRDMECKWTKQEFADGAVGSLAPFGANCAVYLHREIGAPAARDLPVTFGTGGSLTVWLNGEKIHSEKVERQAAADQSRVTLKLKAGKNQLLVKTCHGSGENGFAFNGGTASGPSTEPAFADATAAWGLGADGLCGSHRGDTLSVADFDGDGKPDVLFGAATGVLVLNRSGKFECRTDSGIAYKPGKIGPALCDFDGDGSVDVFVPQPTGSKLFRNLGGGKFEDATARAGDLVKLSAHAVGAAWGDFDNDGKPDLVVACLRGPNRYFRNAGNGSFEDRTDAVGLSQKVFNSQAAALADLNSDGRLDLILNNEGQDSVALFAAVPAEPAKATAVTVQVPGGSGKVTVTGADGKPVASAELFGGDGRGGQTAVPRFVLPPGTYKLAVRGTDGSTREKPIAVASSPMSVKPD